MTRAKLASCRLSARLRCKCCKNDFDAAFRGFGCQRLSPDDRSHKERSEEQVVDEVEVGGGGALTAVDAALEDLGYSGAPRDEVLAHVDLAQLRVGGEVRDQPGSHPSARG